MSNSDDSLALSAEPVTRWSRGQQSLTQPAAPADLSGAALINAQLWIDRAPWRAAAFWAVAAGLLGAGVLDHLVGLDWKQVALIAILADLLWGAIWRLAGGRQVLLALPARSVQRKIWLPYLQADSPAARLFGGDNTDLWPYALRVAVPAVLVALVVAWVLGRPAVLLTGALTLVSALAWTMRRTVGRLPAGMFSLAAIGLPWLLTVLVLAPAWSERQWTLQLALILLWVIHSWGELRADAREQDWLGLGLMAAGEIGICVLLIAAQAPLWLAVLVILFLPTWLAVVRRVSLTRLQALWLLAMLTSALAIGQAF